MEEEKKKLELVHDSDSEAGYVSPMQKDPEMSYLSFALQILIIILVVVLGWALVDKHITKNEDKELELLLSQDRFIEAHEIIEKGQIRQKDKKLTGNELQMVKSKTEAILEFYYYSELGDKAYEKGDYTIANKYYNIALSMYFMNDLHLLRTMEKNIMRIKDKDTGLHKEWE